MISERDEIGAYLSSIGSRKLLTPQEEIEFTKQARAYFDLLQHPSAMLQEEKWAKDAGLSVGELHAAIARGKRARDKLIECNMRLVVTVAKKYQNKGLPLHDLCQEGALGLARAVEKFEPVKGYRFSTYAYHWIQQAITRGIHNSGDTIRLPIHVRAKLSVFNKVVRQLMRETGRSPRIEELAAAMETSVDKIQDAISIQHRRFCPSLDAPIHCSKEEDFTLGNLIFQKADEDTPLIAEGEIEFLWERLSSLPERCRKVLRWRFYEDLTLDECGERLSLSRERVRQIETQAKRLAKQRLSKDWEDLFNL